MITITHEMPEQIKKVDLYHMTVGQIGLTKDGKYFLRTTYTAACLNETGSTYSSLQKETAVYVRILPPGTKITIEVS